MIWTINPSSLISSSPNIVSRLVPCLIFASRRSSRSRYLSSRPASRLLVSLLRLVSSHAVASCRAIIISIIYHDYLAHPLIVLSLPFPIASYCLIVALRLTPSPSPFVISPLCLTRNRADKNGASLRIVERHANFRQPLSPNRILRRGNGRGTRRNDTKPQMTSHRNHGHETATSEMRREQKERKERTRPALQVAGRNENTDCLTRRRARRGETISLARQDTEKRRAGRRNKRRTAERDGTTRHRQIDEMKRIGKRTAKNNHETPHETSKRDEKRDERENDPPCRQRMTQENELTKTVHHIHPPVDTRKIERAAERDEGNGTEGRAAKSSRSQSRHIAHATTPSPQRFHGTETIRYDRIIRARESGQEARRGERKKRSRMPFSCRHG